MVRSVPCEKDKYVKNMFVEMTDKTSKTRVQEQIDQNLRRVYEDTLNAEVPDRFKLLLAQLKDKDRKK